MPPPNGDFSYTAPASPQLARRVYSLPVELVKRIHAYGYATGHRSEVSAVRDLLVKALDAAEASHA